MPLSNAFSPKMAVKTPWKTAPSLQILHKNALETQKNKNMMKFFLTDIQYDVKNMKNI